MRERQSVDKFQNINAFINEWIDCVSSKCILNLCLSDFRIFSDFYEISTQVANSINEISDLIKYDLILGDLSFGMRAAVWEKGSKRKKTQRNWVDLLSSVSFINDEGVALYLLEPTFYFSSKGLEVENELNRLGYYINAVFNISEPLLQPIASIIPTIAVIAKKASDKLSISFCHRLCIAIRRIVSHPNNFPHSDYHLQNSLCPDRVVDRSGTLLRSDYHWNNRRCPDRVVHRPATLLRSADHWCSSRCPDRAF